MLCRVVTFTGSAPSSARGLLRAVWLAGGLALALAPALAAQQPAPIVGAQVFVAPADPARLFDVWQETGINTAFVTEEVLRAPGLRERARERGIRVFLIFPVFCAPAVLEVDADLYAITDEGKPAREEWVRFVCPSREAFRGERIAELARLVRELGPDGVSLDSIRHFVFWEKVYPGRTLLSMPNTCFDDHCMRQFQQRTGVVLPAEEKTPAERAAWVRGRHLNAWAGWKCEQIAEMAGALATAARAERPGLQVAAQIVPWRRNDFGGALRIVAGQDPGQLGARVDLLSPMCFGHMTRQPPEWVSSVVRDLAEQTATPILPSIQVDSVYRDEGLGLEELAQSLEEALRPPSAGVVLRSWRALEKAPDKRALVAAAARRAAP